MARLVGDDVHNVVPLRRSYRLHHHESIAPIRDMADAVRSFERLEHCAAALQSGPFGIVGGLDGTERPIVCFQVQLPVIQQWLDKLGCINVTNWPDVHWVLRLGNARSTALLHLLAVTQSLYRSPPGTRPPDGRLAADIRKLADALRGLRQLIAQQYPEVLRAP
jgi:hypothetical protein